MLPKTLRNVFTVGGFTAFSRVLGLVREMLQARFIGAGVEQSAFTLAFALPNMFRKMFGEGALTAAFIPVFKGEVEQQGLKHAEKLARSVFAMVFLLILAIIALGWVGLGFYSIPRMGEMSERAELIVVLVSILLPYMLFICGAAFGMGVLNALGRFKASSFMPALLNVIWILALASLAFFPGLDVKYRVGFVSIAILFGGLLQFAFMLWRMRCAGINLSRRPMLSWRDEKVVLVWRNLGIGIAGAGAIQINYALDQLLAQLASPWAAGVIGYAERLMDLPLGIVGVAFGTVLLPTFSGFFARQDIEGAKTALVSSTRNLLLVMLPAAIGLFVLAKDITAVIYEGHAFDSIATIRVSRALAIYALGLACFGFQKTLIPFFQAQGDMKTPLKVSVQMVFLNAVMNILAVWLLPVEWRHVGLAASTVITAAIGALLLVIHAHRLNGSLGFGALKLPLLVMIVASLVMGAVVWWVRPYLGTLPEILRLGVLILIGIAVYALPCLLGTLKRTF